METPPPLPYAPSPPQRKWPTVIGTISIVFAVGAFLQSAASPLGTFLVETQMKEFGDGEGNPAKVDEYLQVYRSFVWQSAITMGFVALVLLVGGILLIRRRRLASPLLQTWAVLKILAGGFFLFRTTSMTRLQMSIMMEEILAASPGGPGSQEMQMVNQITGWSVWLGLGVGFLFLLIYPVFLISWFNRRRIQDEMASW